MVTRALRWPGGALAVNADTRGGYLEVRVSDHLRRIVPGFDFDDGGLAASACRASEWSEPLKTLSGPASAPRTNRSLDQPVLKPGPDSLDNGLLKSKRVRW